MSLKKGNLRFGDFLLDLDDQVVMREDTPIQIPPKALNLLCVLIENRGRVVNKDELMDRIWPDSFVEEGNLAFTVRHLRKTLNDDAQHPKFIETVPRRGYRFVADVSEVSAEKPEDTSVDDSLVKEKLLEPETAYIPKRPPPQSSRYLRFIGAGVVALLFLGGLAFYPSQNAKVAENRAQPKVPFRSAQMTKLSNGKALRASVSPDGKQVAYVLEGKEGQSLWLRRTAIESSVQIIPPANVDYLGVNFSRDGDTIYYVTSEPRKFEGTLYTIPVLGGPARKLFDNVTSSIGLSHDGTQLAFTICRQESEGIIRLMVASADGSNLHEVHAENEPVGLATQMPPVWSPDDNRIAVLRTDSRELFGKLIAVNVRDSTVTDLTSNEWKQMDGAEWARDGLVVSGQRQADDAFQLWQIDPTTQAAQKLLNDASEFNGVSLSRDAHSLAAVKNVTLAQLWAVPIANPRNFTQITSGSSDYYDIAFTRQGKLLYASRSRGSGDIWQMNVDDSDHRELTKDSGSNYGPTASSDGRFIFFHSNRDHTYFIYRSLADGSNPRRLTDGIEQEAEADCSPDGKTVVFHNNLQGTSPLKKVSSEGGTPVVLNDKWNRSPAISPDGSVVAVWHAEKFADEWKLALIPLKTGGNPIKSFSAASPEGRIRWTRDGRGLLYVVTVDGVSNIWRQPVDGGKPVPVTQFQNDLIFSFDISPDGKTLVCERGTSAQDVILLSDS